MLGRQLIKSVTSTPQLVQARAHSIVSGPPRVKISFGEKAAHGALMFASWLTIPVWVLTHMKEYKGQK
ncbi:unnamed protein product [Chironomus riparius]|uniref:Uncharacterized protein n=1 Tax=Chironomus riparius TaxID=315576 RepID=A0A9N9S3Z1_9DIPT|nr:unnamed protein product [Chironomus riparius]